MEKSNEEFKIKITNVERETLYIQIALSLIENFYNRGEISLNTMNAIRKDVEKTVEKLTKL